MKIYNTLTRQKEEFLPREDKKVRMFVCGPTVYDYIHIGNARTFVVFDVIAKYLRYCGYKLKYIQNITDIDDRIINRAKETGVEPKELAQKFEKIFVENMKALKADSVDKYPRATEYIKEIIKQVKTLKEKGNAYLVEGDGWYFDLKTFPEYGKLSGRTAEMAEDAVSRIDESAGKRNRGDFCLWKFSKPGEPTWAADIGAGRPGWHIEDTAITEKYFGPQYDIHGGGQDLIFPHHEAEIAQQESASGLKPFVKYWLHAGFVVRAGEKMSKSRGVFLTTEEALKKYSPEALRFYFLSAHYRSPLDYSEENLKAAEAGVQRISRFKERIDKKTYNQSVEKNPNSSNWIKRSQERLEDGMGNDFNTPEAIATLFSWINDANDAIGKKTFDQDLINYTSEIVGFAEKILGIVPQQIQSIPAEVQKIIDQRQAAREQKDFKVADELREQIKNLGYEVDDTVYGPLVKRR